jgi:hypothetical protein
MKKICSVISMAFPLIALLVFTGCIKDTTTRTHTYTIYEPVYKTTAEVRANIKSNNPTEVQKPGKIYLRGQYIFLNEVDKGIHVIDNSNPSMPKNVAFIDIPGNVDLAVKGNTLYADLYTDLITIDISNPLSVQVTKIIENVFPHRFYNNGYRPDSTKVIMKWIQRDTTVTEKIDMAGWMRGDNRRFYMALSSSDASKASAFASPVGMGGSMARFAIASERLYTVGETELNVFNISAGNPTHVKKTNVGWNIETIYPFKNKLFIGSTTGMFIYDISNASNPYLQGQFTHVQSCDPVIADDHNAYVTLRSGNTCRGGVNELQVLNIASLDNPRLVKPML